MAKAGVEEYIDELMGFESGGKDMDLYSLKKELVDLDESSSVFENFEKETKVIDKDALSQIMDLSLLVKIRNLASEIRNKSKINEKLHSLHFNLNLLKNYPAANNAKSIKNAFNIFLHNDETKIDNIINELNDFKSKLHGAKKVYSKLLPKSLDNKIKIENKYDKHIERLHSIHKRQRNALISTVKLFLKLTKKQIKYLKSFK